MGRTERMGLAIAGGVAALLVAAMLGYVAGRSGASSADATTAATPASQVSASAGASPTLGPAISAQGAVLSGGDNQVIAGSITSDCKTLVSASDGGDCGEVTAGATTAIWTVDGQPTLGPAGHLSAHVFTYSSESAGWVERLSASGGNWQSINVVASDLTADGVDELIVGYRGPSEEDRLDVDIVGFSSDGTPEVLAHLDPATKGSVVVSGGALVRYAAQYPNGEAVCCPPSYRADMIRFDAGSFRVVQQSTVAASAVPHSEL